MSALYFHYPYCTRKCPYCDFFSVAENPKNLFSYYAAELAAFAKLKSECKITSIFFGGGTPSLMEAQMVERLLSEAAKNFHITRDAEITLEANPGSLTKEKIAAFKEAGINRFSLGVQSFNDDNLQFLGRIHDAKTAINNIKLVAKTFANYSIDLIYALPHQTIRQLEEELATLFAFNPPHFSMYQLTIEKNTPFYKTVSSQIDEKLAAKMFALLNHQAKKAGYVSYEISNFAKPKFESRHNSSYWQGDEYIGVGPAASSRLLIDGFWYEKNNPKNILLWQDGKTTLDTLSNRERAVEMIMTGLRSKQGFELAKLQKLGLNFNDLFEANRLSYFIELNMLKKNTTHLRLLSRGRLFLNYILSEILAA